MLPGALRRVSRGATPPRTRRPCPRSSGRTAGCRLICPMHGPMSPWRGGQTVWRRESHGW